MVNRSAGLLVLLLRSLVTDDEILMLPDEGGLLFPAHGGAGLSLLLSLLAGTTTTLLVSFVALALETVFDRPYPVEDQLVDIFDDVKDAQLMLNLSPVALQTVFVKRRPIGNDTSALRPRSLRAWRNMSMWA